MAATGVRLALALSEFGHYDWEDFQQNLIQSIGDWEHAPEGERGDWQYYDHWVAALVKRSSPTTTFSTAPVPTDAGDHAVRE